MHMADALISPTVGAAMYTASAVAAVYSVKKIKEENDLTKIPVMGVTGAFVFATQMLNFTIPGTGASGHLCGGMLLTAILGPYAAFLTMISILLIQCLLFADGGLLALGCNIWNMAFYGCFLGYFLIWSPMMKGQMTRKRIMAASIIGCVVTLQLGAFSVVLETLASGITALPFSVFALTMQPIHLIIGFIEGLITAAVLVFVYESRPELLRNSGNAEASGKRSLKMTLAILAVITVLCGGLFSLFASSNPDGLEWSIERIVDGDLEESDEGAYATAGKIQEATAILPDYAFKNSETVAGTTVSGIAGSAVVVAVCALVCVMLKALTKKKA
ncbi:MAG: energy-coupling factor ABC transporter permease [Eubacteriales bacterium]|nr:energy-coupling factor ABC transporter permease [Eubacteriales bacterium]